MTPNTIFRLYCSFSLAATPGSLSGHLGALLHSNSSESAMARQAKDSYRRQTIKKIEYEAIMMGTSSK